MIETQEEADALESNLTELYKEYLSLCSLHEMTGKEIFLKEANQVMLAYEDIFDELLEWDERKSK